MRHFFLPLLFCCLFVKFGFAQKLLDFKHYDTTTYVFKLDNAQMDFIVQSNGIVDTSFLFTHLHKKASRNSDYTKGLGNGNYLIATVDQALVYYRFYAVSSFDISHRVIGNDVIVFIKDKKTHAPISTASVSINSVAVPFSEGYGGYAFDKKSIDVKLLAQYKVLLRVSVGDNYLATHYNFYGNNPTNYRSRRFFTGTKSLVSSGYVITDKPVYRPGDTLRLKAFLCNPITGKPHKRRATFSMAESSQNFSFKQHLKASSPGAFVFEWKIPDTLKIDRTFQMSFNYKKRRTYFNYGSTFYLENYVLGTTNYEAYLSKQEFFPNEDIQFKVQASDANGFPLQGSMIHYKLSLQSVQDFFGDSLTLSEAKRNNLYELDTLYPYESSLSLKIPSSVLPNMDATYNLEISITDPNTFEQKLFNLSCSRLQKTEKLLLYQEEDSLFVRYLYNGRDTVNTYRLRIFSNGDSLSNQTIRTPYRCKLSPYATLAYLTDKQNVSTSRTIYYNALDISKVKGERTADSIRIAFSFPFEEAIYYRILKKDILVQQGKTKKLDFKIADNTKDAYTILFTSNINNAIESNFYRITYVPPLHKIKLRSTLPSQAFPGQTLKVQVEASDCYNKPLKDINIAAFALNKQFNERYVRPVISIPEAYKDLVDIHQEQSTEQIALATNNYELQWPLSPQNFSRFDLYHNEYYTLRYPKTEYSVLTKTIQSALPEFAISVTSKHITYTPKYILLDGQSIYISDLQASPYSFQTNTGNHQISFRFADKTITVNDISFAAHTKNWLGFNMDSLSLKSKTYSVVDSLPIAQPTEPEKNLLYGSLLLTNQFGYDSLLVQSGNQAVFISNSQMQRPATSLYVDGDLFYAFGPLNPAYTAVVKLNKKEFNLKISTEYAHYYDARTQEFTTKLRGAVKGAILGFAEIQLQDWQLANMQVYDTVKPQPVVVPMTFNQDANQAIKKEREPDYSQYYNSGGPAYFSINFKNEDTARYVKAIWLINKKTPEHSEYSRINDRITLSLFQKRGAEGLYDIYFLMNNQRMLVLRDHAFKQGDAFYLDPTKLNSETLSNDKLASALKIYTDLTKLPLLPFYFPPEESTETIKETKDEKRTKTYVHGYVTNEALQPLSNVMVLAEVNGKFSCGALTNNVGEFEILDMLPGSYQLKFYASGFQLKSLTTRFFKAGYSYELNTNLKSSNLQKPVLETIHKDFRFMVFNGNARKNLMKLNVYDKDTRSALQNYTVTLKEVSTEAAEKTYTAKEELEFEFLPQSKVYNVEITCKGYVPVTFHNVRFCKNSFYALYLFMANEKENSWLKKKDYDLQMQYYSATAEIGADRREGYLTGEVMSKNLSYAAGSSPSASYASPMLEEVLATQKGVVYQKFKHIVNVPTQHGVSDVEHVDQEAFDENGNSIDEVAIVSKGKKDGIYADSISAVYVSDDMINQVIANTELSQVRKNFTDVGFWQPNLVTNKKGQVNFEITLPDNITTWKANILAMGDHHLHGIDTTDIKAYKPLQVSALVPAYLWKGDKLWAKAKYTNLTKDAKTISGILSVNGIVGKKSEFSVKNDVLDSLQIEAKTVGPLLYKANLQFEDKYKDAEQRQLFVYNPAFRFFSNQSFNMEKDSTYRLQFEPGTKGEIILNNSLYEKIVEEVNQLSNYEYSCVEQTSSQLKALLCKEKINRVLQSKENLNPSIYKLVHQLDNYQNKNGTWGWWKKQAVNWRMTIYAVEALGKAKASGYNNNAFYKGVKAIKENFTSLSLSDRLYAYAMLQDLGLADATLKKLVQVQKLEELSTADKLHYYKAKETDGEKVSFNDLYAVYLELNTAMARPYYGDFFYEPRSNLFEAYNLFSKSASGKEFIELFKRKLLSGQLDYNLNTYAKAALIEALTASTQNTDDKPVTAQVIINDTLKIKTFPYRLPIARNNYSLKHSDANVFVNTAEEKFVDTPKRNDSLFKVSTHFVQNGKTSTDLKAGQTCLLNIDIDAYKSYDYVMIEVPLPAGLRFVTKTQPANCSVEYFPNKMVIFYQRLNMQQHHLSFEMMPNFKGSFEWPAAKCSLMYYPYLYGNNENQKVEVR